MFNVWNHYFYDYKGGIELKVSTSPSTAGIVEDAPAAISKYLPLFTVIAQCDVITISFMGRNDKMECITVLGRIP